jgi:hypothetical protein
MKELPEEEKNGYVVTKYESSPYFPKKVYGKMTR